MKSFASWLLFASVLILAACNPDDSILPSSPNGVDLRTFTLSPCAPDRRIPAGALPQAALDYVTANYAGYTLSSIRRYDTPDGVRFSVEVEIPGPDAELLFNEGGELIASGQSTSSQHVAYSALPQAARDYIEANFAGQQVEEVKIKTAFGVTIYDVELANSTDIYFTTDGALICVDLDDSGNGYDDNGGSNSGDDNSGGYDDSSNGSTLLQNPCSPGSSVSLASLPQTIRDQVSAAYGNYSVFNVRRHNTPDGIRYTLEIDTPGANTFLLFNEAGELLATDQSVSSQHVAYSDLPQTARDYIAANFPGQAVDEVKRRTAFGITIYDVELVNSTDIYFTTDGALICVRPDDNDDDNDDDDDDDDSDDDNGGSGNNDDDDDDDDDNSGGSSSTNLTFNDLPQAARDYINANYGNAVVEEVERGLLCNGTMAYEVGLEGAVPSGFYLFFNLSGELLFTQRRISQSDLPVAVTQAIANQFAAFQIEDNKIARQNFPDGSIRYEVRLRPNNGDEKLTVAFSATGEVLCSYHD